MEDKKTLKENQNRDTSSKNSQKAFFFLRHNNDIDHITPILYKWLSTKNIPTDIIITSNRKLLDDYRINYLKKFKNVRIFYINDLFKKYSLEYFFNIFYFKYTNDCDKIIKRYSYIKKIANRTINHIANRIFKEINKGIVVFDWTITHFVQQILQNAKERGYTTISLPHGDRPYINFFETKNDLNYSCMESHKPLEIFDYVVVPNNLCFKRYENYVEKHRIKVLGSPRYSDEWMEIISDSIAPFNIEGSEKKLKIVFFLRNINYPIFWDEVVRTIKLILQFPNIYLIVKHHPRNTTAKKLTKKLINLYPEVKQDLDKNLKFIYAGVSSDSLLKWADLIIDIGTSVTWEPVKRGQPVLMLEYLHSNYSTVAYYIKGSEMKCKDELYDMLQAFIKNKNPRFYDEKERKKFIKEVIDVPDKHILERYCEFLESCFNDKKQKGNNE